MGALFAPIRQFVELGMISDRRDFLKAGAAVRAAAFAGAALGTSALRFDLV